MPSVTRRAEAELVRIGQVEGRALPAPASVRVLSETDRMLMRHELVAVAGDVVWLEIKSPPRRTW